MVEPTVEHYLIVDDDEVFANILARRLVQQGQKSRVALNAAQALEQCQRFSPSRIILDLKLGDESGLQLLPRLSNAAPDAAIVLLTGYSSIPTAVEAVKLGAQNYLCKPAEFEEIIRAFSKDGTATDNPMTQPMRTSIDRLEWEHIQRVLNENNGNISATARALGMHRRTLQRKLQKRPVEQ